ncbi:MAG TPA: hypothetical protein VEA37_14055, partial [Flavobacterium sp.]|nr:hypothetical protein [Flavobacterium sp.]
AYIYRSSNGVHSVNLWDILNDFKEDCESDFEMGYECDCEAKYFEDEFDLAPEFDAMVDQEKYDLFMEYYEKFTLEQFEGFIKKTVKI